MSTNQWIDFLKKYHASHPNITYKEAMVQASKVYKKQSGGGKDSSNRRTLVPYGPMRTMEMKRSDYARLDRNKMLGLGKRRQRGRGEIGEDEIDISTLMEQLNMSDYDTSIPSMSTPSMPSLSNPRKEARDTRFMTRKMMNQLIKLKRKNDRHKLGYTIEQLKEMASKGITI